MMFHTKLTRLLAGTTTRGRIALIPLPVCAFVTAAMLAILSTSSLFAQETMEPDLLRSGTNWAAFIEPGFPFFSSSLDARKLGPDWATNNLTPRALILNLGNDTWAAWDTELLRIAVVWNGKTISETSMSRISYHSPGAKSVEGEDHLPQILGQPLMANGLYPGWQAGNEFLQQDPRSPGPDPREIGRGALPKGMGRFKGLELISGGVKLISELQGAEISEWITSRIQEGHPVIQRRVLLEPSTKTRWLSLGRAATNDAPKPMVKLSAGQVEGQTQAELVEQPDGLFLIKVPPSSNPLTFRVALGSGFPVETWLENDAPSTAPLAHWPGTLITHVSLATNQAAYVVDNFGLPTGNPWKRNVRLADVAFFRDGRAAAVSFDGDVWLIEGLGGSGHEIKWRRFASGLHEPLSLCIRNDEIFVFDRNGIWRLRDPHNSGEATVYELFSNAFAQTAETREYADSMKLAPDGSFIIGKGGIEMSTLGKHNGTVMRVSADGKSATMLAYGLRSPFVGVHPRTGLITASDQQGHYVPSTPLHIIRDQQYYGFLSVLQPKEEYPAPIADPLTWIPYPVNASGASQVWLTDARMGPLNDALIHLGYYRPEVFVVRLNERSSKPQAAVLSLTRDLQFAPLNAAVNPVDGQLYVIGFQIFGTTAKQISGLARVRYTGAPVTLPREVVPMKQGVLIRFEVPLDPQLAVNPANYSAERWNYKRTYNYGSAHYKQDGSKGQDTLTPSSAYLSKDGRSVFVGIPDLSPVNQMRLGWSLRMREGMVVDDNAYFTPYEFPDFDPEKEGFEPLTVDLTPKTRATAAVKTPVTIEEGRRLAQLLACANCHSADGSTLAKVGPSWKGLFEKERVFSDGSRTNASEIYLRQSIREPSAKIVRGYEKSEVAMPTYEGLITDDQLEALILYIKSLK